MLIIAIGLAIVGMLPVTAHLTRLHGYAPFIFMGIAFLIVLILVLCMIYVYKNILSDVNAIRGYITQLNKNKRITTPHNFFIKEMADLSNDITDMCEQNEDLVRKRIAECEKELEADKAKIYSKHILSNNLNHEVKTPIGIISGYLETLASHKDLPEVTKQRFIKSCQDNIQRLQNIVYDITLITRIEDGSNSLALDEVCMDNVTRQIERDFDVMMKQHGISLEINIDDEIFVESNEILLYNILGNLVKNSCNYSGGNHITFELADVDNEFYTFRFYDNGTGIDEEQIPHIFDRFFRASKVESSMGNSGLGLAIVKESVEMCGGSISVSNKKNGGLEFLFTLKKL